LNLPATILTATKAVTTEGSLINCNNHLNKQQYIEVIKAPVKFITTEATTSATTPVDSTINFINNLIVTNKKDIENNNSLNRQTNGFEGYNENYNDDDDKEEDDNEVTKRITITKTGLAGDLILTHDYHVVQIENDLNESEADFISGYEEKKNFKGEFAYFVPYDGSEPYTLILGENFYFNVTAFQFQS
ncbi:uncharacterized protein LOC119642278, partial [Glossina fuscipes]|uniref:Uncharacterized protein LOC119642278 n=1 Tax=Glossina fuscipes TaxID=7396 RepID=A0A9C6DZB9_9MUSC